MNSETSRCETRRSGRRSRSLRVRDAGRAREYFARASGRFRQIGRGWNNRERERPPRCSSFSRTKRTRARQRRWVAGLQSRRTAPPEAASFRLETYTSRVKKTVSGCSKTLRGTCLRDTRDAGSSQPTRRARARARRCASDPRSAFSSSSRAGPTAPSPRQFRCCVRLVETGVWARTIESDLESHGPRESVELSKVQIGPETAELRGENEIANQYFTTHSG